MGGLRKINGVMQRYKKRVPRKKFLLNREIIKNKYKEWGVKDGKNDCD